MVVTTLHKLIGLSVAMLGQAPGTDLLNQWTRLYTQSREDGMNAMAALQKVAQHILDSAAFAEVHPAYTIIENSDFARQFLKMVLGEDPSDQVVTVVVDLLEGGTSRAEVAVRAVQYLLEVNQQGSDHADYATFGTYAMRFGNQVEVARYYTVDKKWMTPGESVLAEVDDTAASVTAAKSDIDGMQQPGKNFALTTGVDQFTGTPGNDTLVATESTLNGADRLNGKEGMDTLELSSGSGANADISIPRGATVSHIETLSVSSDGDFSGDISKWEGLKTVQLEVVKDVDLELNAGGGTEVTSTSLGDDDKASTVTIENAGMVELEGVNHNATVKITGEGTESVMVKGGKGVDVNSAASPSLTLKSVTLDGVHDGMGKDGKRYGTGDNKDSVPVHIYSKVIEDITVRNTNTTLLVQNDDKDMTRLTAMVDRFGMYATAAEHGKLCLKGIEDLMLKVAGDSNIRLASDQIKQVEVSGAGDLRLNVTRFAPAVAEKAADLKASTTLETLMLSGSGKFMLDAMGLSKLMTVDAGDATGDVDIKNLGKSVTEYTGSAGKDMVSVAAFNSKGLMANLGAGDDTFTVVNTAAGNSKINGGAGMDTLVLKQDKGANIKGAGDAYMNFEKITLDAGGGSGTYDLKGLDVDELMLSEGLTYNEDDSNADAAADAKKITFKNVTPGTDLFIANGGNFLTHLFNVSYMLEDERTFIDHLDLRLHGNGAASDTIPARVVDRVRPTKPEFTRLTIDLDKDIEVLNVNTSFTPRASKLKAADYSHSIDKLTAEGLEGMIIVGDVFLDILSWAGEINLDLMDAREHTGGISVRSAIDFGQKDIEFHGSSAYDSVVLDGGDDELMGYGGDDALVGGAGKDKIAGGAGGDELTGNAWGLPGGGAADGARDTFIYTMASDSRVEFAADGKPSGMDVIFGFDAGDGANKDRIDLSALNLDVRGGVKELSNASITDKSLNGLIKASGKGLFTTKVSGQLDATKNSVAYAQTTEDRFDNVLGSRINAPGTGTVPGGHNPADAVTVHWYLVDVDGDGDFDAATDMAIALINTNSVSKANLMDVDNFIV